MLNPPELQSVNCDEGLDYLLLKVMEPHANRYGSLLNPSTLTSVKDGNSVHIQLFLLNAPSPLRYCQKALHSSRLLVPMKNSPKESSFPNGFQLYVSQRMRV